MALGVNGRQTGVVTKPLVDIHHKLNAIFGVMDDSDHLPSRSGWEVELDSLLETAKVDKKKLAAISVALEPSCNLPSFQIIKGKLRVLHTANNRRVTPDNIIELVKKTFQA